MEGISVLLVPSYFGILFNFFVVIAAVNHVQVIKAGD
jgi:hypothetical protein